MLAAGVPILPGVPVPATDDPLFTAPSWLLRRPAAICPVACVGRYGDAASAITLVTQCSLDRLPRLRGLLCAWGGAASAAVLLDSPEGSEAAVEGESSVRYARSLPTAVSARTIVSGYVGQLPRLCNDTNGDNMPKAGGESCSPMAPPAAVSDQRPVHFALDNARTELFPLDVDFVPSASLAPRCAEQPPCTPAFRPRARRLWCPPLSARWAAVAAAFSARLRRKRGCRRPSRSSSRSSMREARRSFTSATFPRATGDNLARWRQANGRARSVTRSTSSCTSSRAPLPAALRRAFRRLRPQQGQPPLPVRGRGPARRAARPLCHRERAREVVLVETIFGDKRDLPVAGASISPSSTGPLRRTCRRCHRRPPRWRRRAGRGRKTRPMPGGAQEAKEDVEDEFVGTRMALIDVLDAKVLPPPSLHRQRVRRLPFPRPLAALLRSSAAVWRGTSGRSVQKLSYTRR